MYTLHRHISTLRKRSVVNGRDRDIRVGDFEFQSRNNIQFRTNTLG